MSLTYSTTANGSIGVIAFDDGKANAISPAVVGELHELLDRAEGDNVVRALVVHGRAGVFSAGFDLQVMRRGVEPMRELVRDGGRLLLRIFGSPLPIVVGCTGHALAAGALVLLAADHRVGPGPDPATLDAGANTSAAAVPAAKIGLNEVAIGLRLPVYAMELARYRLTPAAFEPSTVAARLVGPARAVEAGFLDELAGSVRPGNTGNTDAGYTGDADQVVQRAIERAGALAELDRVAYAATKVLARQAVITRIGQTLEDDVATLDPPASP